MHRKSHQNRLQNRHIINCDTVKQQFPLNTCQAGVTGTATGSRARLRRTQSSYPLCCYGNSRRWAHRWASGGVGGGAGLIVCRWRGGAAGAMTDSCDSYIILSSKEHVFRKAGVHNSGGGEQHRGSSFFSFGCYTFLIKPGCAG